jgi:hypothetical protein
MNRLLLLFLTFIPFMISAGNLPAERARGIFTAFGVGPRIPINAFSVSTDLGYGFNIELSYTDNEFLPIFLFSRIGFEQYPGSQDYYESSAYSNFSTTSFPLNIGGRYYFAPMLENVVLFLPFLEVSAAINFYSELHQFKPGSGRSNFSREITKFGGSAGIGISMFLMEILASYNYFKINQFLSIDLKVRLPLYINY